MAEHASHADLHTPRETTRRTAEAASRTTPLQSDRPGHHPGARTRAQQETVPKESAADRYAFYFFMGTITVGVLAMIVLAFTI